MLNLDDYSCDPADYMALYDKLSRGSRRAATEIFPDKPVGFVRAARDIGHYAANKATAMNLRKLGNVNGAQAYEAICQRIYDNLPEFARW